MEQYLYRNLYQKYVETRITDIIELNGNDYVVIEDNIFYPQGGGQKGDKGNLTIDGIEYKVLTTIKHPDSKTLALLNLEELLPANLKGSKCTADLDWDFRYKQMRLHSTLHLYHYLLEQILGKLDYPVLSMINDDGTAVLRYENSAITDRVIEKATDELKNIINKGNELITFPDKEREGFRYWKYDEHVIPCGGTHLKDTSEIGNIKVEFYVKRGQESIKFALEN